MMCASRQSSHRRRLLGQSRSEEIAGLVAQMVTACIPSATSSVEVTEAWTNPACERPSRYSCLDSGVGGPSQRICRGSRQQRAGTRPPCPGSNRPHTRSWPAHEEAFRSPTLGGHLGAGHLLRHPATLGRSRHSRRADAESHARSPHCAILRLLTGPGLEEEADFGRHIADKCGIETLHEPGFFGMQPIRCR